MSLFSIGGNLGYALGPSSTTPLVLAPRALAAAALLASAVPPASSPCSLLRSLRSSRGFAPEQTRGADAPARIARRAALLAPRRRRPAQRRLVRAPHVRAALGGLARTLEGVRQPPARADAPRRRCRDAGRSGRSPTASAAGPCSSRASSSRRSSLVYVAVGGAVGAVALALVGVCVVGTFGVTMVMSQEYMPRTGIGSRRALDRLLDRPRRDRGGRPRRVADAVDLETALYISAAVPALVPRASAAVAPRSRAQALPRAGGVAARRRMTTAREFFEGLEGRLDPSKTAGMTNSYVFEIDGAGTWRVDVDDGTVKVTEMAATEPPMPRSRPRRRFSRRS